MRSIRISDAHARFLESITPKNTGHTIESALNAILTQVEGRVEETEIRKEIEKMCIERRRKQLQQSLYDIEERLKLLGKP